MNWTAIVPLRAGSRGLPGKNVRPLKGQPLYRHAIQHAIDAGAARVVVSTDIEEVLQDAHPATVHALARPRALCSDDTPMAPVVLHAIDSLALTGTLVLLQPTSPLRAPADIAAGLATFSDRTHQLVMSVTEGDRSVLKWGLAADGKTFTPLADPAFCFSNRQSLPAVYRPNGAVYVFDAGWFAANKGFATDRIGIVVMPPERSFDIDSQSDFDRCERILSERPGQ